MNNSTVFRTTSSPRGQAIIRKIEEFLETLKDFNTKIFEEWVRSVPLQIEISLKQSLLKRNGNMELILNFNPQVH